MSKDLVEAVRNIIPPETAGKALDPLVSRGAASPQTSAALLKGSGGGGSGIASPLVETAYANRTWHIDTTINSSDGIFTLVIKPVKQVFFKDKNGADVEMEYKAP